MVESLARRIGDHVTSSGKPLAFPPASEDCMQEAEGRLGFSIPPLLKLCYLKVGNGGFGPGYGLIGVRGGYESDFGTLVETYEQLKGDYASQGMSWEVGLLPFCEWGCGTFSCVDCGRSRHAISQFEDFEVRPRAYTLSEFFEMWLGGTDILSHGASARAGVRVINPFTGKPTVIRRRTQ
ncbi:MAG: SMI1/KNR4 family protein [Isosphaeraceae bacterium]